MKALLQLSSRIAVAASLATLATAFVNRITKSASLHGDPGAPSLEVAATNGAVTLSWTSQMTFTLLSTDKLETNIQWTVVTNEPSETVTPAGKLYRVTLSNARGSKIFALRR
jgi:hypothetical protein